MSDQEQVKTDIATELEALKALIAKDREGHNNVVNLLSIRKLELEVENKALKRFIEQILDRAFEK